MSRGASHRHVALLALTLSAVGLGGCHDEERLRQRLEGPTPARLPVEPDQPETPPAPALLDTVRQWRQPARFAALTRTWPIVTASATDDLDLTYRVPPTWTIGEADGGASNRSGDVVARARVTELEDSAISLATYAAQLAEGNPIWQYATADGHVVYITRRVVSLAPSDPNAPREVFHTAVTSVDGRIAKLDVRYDQELDWRWDELAKAITGTLQVRRVGR